MIEIDDGASVEETYTGDRSTQNLVSMIEVELGHHA